ncbi:MAG: cytochrome c biogenesis protein CcdA [Methylococcales bacterium]
MLVWLLTGAAAFAEIPKAEINTLPLNTGQWPLQLQLNFTVPKDHHAYLDKGVENIYIPIRIDPKQKLAETGLTIKQLQAPTGRFDKDVKASVLRDTGLFVLELSKPTAPRNPGNIAVDVNYQLCSDVSHVCYRPQTTSANLNLPAVLATPAQPSSSVSFTDQLLQLFKDNRNNTFILFALMLLAGVLSVATPCVYPMLPITSMFIVNRANGVAKQEALHALAYLIGIIGTYMMLGLIAGMTGGAFNTFMQSAWVNLGFAVFFAFFAIALLGFYELSFMQNEVHSLDQHSARINGLAGTWMMGSVAGLVISPCVGPIVFALLLQVADNIADKADALAVLNQSLSFWDKLVIASQGSIMMAGFGVGVGLPFFLVSVIKFKKLPKAGYWMNKIKYAFGLMILYFAYVYFHKGMSVLGVDSNATLSLAFGMLGVWIAVVHCNVLTLLPVGVQPNQKMLHFCGVLTIIFGAWLIIAGLGHTPIMKTAAADCPLTTAIPAAASSPIEADAGIAWYRSFTAAHKAAQQAGKPIFIDFYASWCANCIAFKEETANNPQLNQALREKAISVKLIDKEPEFEQFRGQPEHRQLKIGLPYFAILSTDGKLLWSSTDYKAGEQIVAVLNQQKS